MTRPRISLKFLEWTTETGNHWNPLIQPRTSLTLHKASSMPSLVCVRMTRTVETSPPPTGPVGLLRLRDLPEVLEAAGELRLASLG